MLKLAWLNREVSDLEIAYMEQKKITDIFLARLVDTCN